MEANGWSFSHPTYSMSFIVAGTPERATYCANVPDDSYCGFAHPGVGVLSFTIPTQGSLSITYGSTWSTSSSEYIIVTLNDVETHRIVGLDTATISLNIDVGDVVSFSEYGETVINIHNFVLSVISGNNLVIFPKLLF